MSCHEYEVRKKSKEEPLYTVDLRRSIRKRAHAKVLKVDCSAAEKCSGFVKYFSARDVPGSNHIGAIVKDEEVFVESVVQHFGAVSPTS